jgi:hypothetical protein
MPDGPPARMRQDVAKDIKKLPKSGYDRPEWRFAVQVLIEAGEDGGPMSFARIGISRAVERRALEQKNPLG